MKVHGWADRFGSLARRASMSGLRALRHWFHPPGDLYHWVNLLLLAVITVLVVGVIESGALR